MDPATQVIESAIIEIQSLADSLDSTDTTKLPEPEGGKGRHPLRGQPQIHHRNGQEIDSVCQIGSQGR